MHRALSRFFTSTKEFTPHAARVCGHHIECQEQEITVFSTRRLVCLPLTRAKADFCHDCLAWVAVNCYHCKRAILPGDPISLDKPYEFKIYDERTLFVIGGKTCVVACGRLHCAASLAHCQGRWVARIKEDRIVGAVRLPATGRIMRGAPKLDRPTSVPPRRLDEPAFYANQLADLPDNVVVMPLRAA